MWTNQPLRSRRVACVSDGRQLVRILSGSLFLISLTLASSVTRADALSESIPADAKVAVIAGDLKAIDSDVKALAKKLELPLPPDASLLESIKSVGLSEVWEIERGAALVVIEPSEDGVALVMPVADGKKAAAKLGGESKGDVYSFSIIGQPWSALAKDKVLVFAKAAKILEGFRSPAKSLEAVFTPAQKKLRSESKLYAYVNVPAWRPLAEPLLKQGRAQIAMLENVPNDAAQPFSPVVMGQFAGKYFDLLETLLQQTESVHAGLALSHDVLTLRQGAVFAKDSMLAKKFVEPKETAGRDLLAKLPDRGFLIAAAFDGVQTSQLMGDVMNAFFEMAAAAGKIDNKEIKELRGKTADLYKHVKAMNFLLDFSKKGMAQIGYYEVDNAAEFGALLESVMKSSSAIMSLGMPGKAEISHSKKQVGGREIHESIASFENMPDEVRELLKKMYGGTKIKTQFGKVGDRFGFAQDATTDNPITLLDQSGVELSRQPRIRAATAALPAAPAAIVLVDPLAYGRMIQTMMEENGLGGIFPLKFPKTSAPPIAAAFRIENGGVSGHVALHVDTLRILVKLGMVVTGHSAEEMKEFKVEPQDAKPRQ